MEPYIEKQYFLSASDTNAEGSVSFSYLTRNIIDIATEHANSLGIGNPSMVEMNAGWILSRITIELFEVPRVNSEYKIKTWIEDFNRHFSTRSFKIYSEDGHTYGFCRTIWLVIDAETHKNLGLSHFNLPEEMILGEKAPIKLQEKHFPIFKELTSDAPAKSIQADYAPFEYTFKYCDLDFYRHVNTVRYVELLLNQFSLKEHDETEVKRIELSFLHEACYGMKTELLRSDSNKDRLLSSFQLTNCENNNALLFARIKREIR